MTTFLDNTITYFLLKAKKGPDYVWTCCHRLMYKQNVILCKKNPSTLRQLENSLIKCFVQSTSTLVMMATYGYAVHVTVPCPVGTCQYKQMLTICS